MRIVFTASIYHDLAFREGQGDLAMQAGFWWNGRLWTAALVLGVCSAYTAEGAFVTEYVSGILWSEPKVIDPGPPGGPPSDAVVLFNGTDMSQWNGGDKWT